MKETTYITVRKKSVAAEKTNGLGTKSDLRANINKMQCYPPTGGLAHLAANVRYNALPLPYQSASLVTNLCNV